MRTIIKYAVDEYYQVFYKLSDLVVYKWRISDRFKIAIFTTTSIITNYIITINFNLKYMLSNDVTIYNDDEAFRIFSSVITKYKDIFTNFKNIIDIPEE